MKSKLNPNDPKDAEDLNLINSMISSMTDSIQWMETRKDPLVYRGIHKNAVYQLQYHDNMDLIPDITVQLENVNEKQLYMTREEKIILADILSSFTSRERQCYILHVGQKMSLRKIADELGISKGTVQGYINRVENILKEKVS